jgi:hypothetical protein
LRGNRLEVVVFSPLGVSRPSNSPIPTPVNVGQKKIWAIHFFVFFIQQGNEKEESTVHMLDCYRKFWKNPCTSLVATYHSVTCAHSPEGEVGKFNPTL